MLNRFLKLLRDPGPAETPQEPVQLASAALLVEAASLDGTYDAMERARIEHLLAKRFDLDAAAVEALLAAAERRTADSVQLEPFTRAVKNASSEAERIELIEMAWEVAYADGRLDDYEANLMRRLGGLLGIADRDVGAARKRVLSRLGLSSDLG